MNKTRNVLWSLLGLGAVLVVAYVAILASSDPQPERKKIIVGVYDNHPKVFTDADGQPRGIFIDILQSIAESEQLDVTFVAGEWSDLFEQLEVGTIDVLPDVAYSDERDSLFTLSAPVIGSWIQIFDNDDASLSSVTDLAGKRVGLLEGSIQETYLSEFVMRQFDIKFDIIPYPDYNTTVRAMKRGEIDVFAADRFYYFSDPSDPTIHPTGIVLRPSNLHYAFSKDVDPEIVARVNRSLAELRNNPDSDYYKSVQDWFGIRYKSDVSEALIWVFLVVVGALILVSSFAITLNYTVQQKTRDLVNKNAELQIAKEKAEESDRLKTVFLQNMSHEIRTPMNGILGFLELLREPELDDETKSAYVGIMNESGHRLMDTINNIVEISKIESKQVRVSQDVVDINQCLESNYEAFKYQASSKGLDLNLHMGIGAHRSVILADEYIMNIVFTNLLVNAIKFTKRGSVDFGASIDGDRLICFVRDTGPGIAPDRQAAIFDRFVQEHVETTRPYEGSGLGLAIVKAYLEMVEGSVWVESELGKGSTFWFSIPYKPSHMAPGKSEIDAHIQLADREMNILVVEDDDVSYRFLTEILKSDKVQIYRASNGFEAVQAVRDHPDLSLVLMDIKMPEMDGLEATRRIRSFNVEVPIVAQTAYALDGDRERALEIGCNEYVTKPIDIDRLLDIVNRYARTSS